MTSVPDIARKNAEVCGYSLEELERFREGFSAEIEEHQAQAHRFALPILALFIASFAAVLCASLLFHPPLTWLLITGFALVAIELLLITIMAIAFRHEPICPACHNYFIEEIQDYCPECGSSSLGSHDWRGARRCNACGKNLRAGKNRNFKYKACTTCGIFLYQKGL